MTWTYILASDYSSLEVYDHTGALITTLTNDGSGFSPKQDALQVMENEAIAEYQANGWSPRLLKILRDAIFENIKEQ